MRPLEGIRVLDLTHVLAGPFTTFQLAVLGADVIKIEGPQSPDMTRIEGVVPDLSEELRGTYFMAQNAGKRAMTLNLKSKQGQDILRDLVARSDVLVENYSAGKLDDLGLGADAMAKVNPKLVYCSITGFGQTGPKRGHPAYDVVIQAYSGIMAANGPPGVAPVRVGPPMVDYGTGTQAALSICAALIQRSRTGKGQRIDVAMLDCALMLMSAFVTDTLVTGAPPAPHTNAHAHYAGYATFETADGLLMLGAWSNRQLARVMRVLGHDERAREVEATSRSEIGKTLAADAGIISQALKEQSADEWERVFNEAHVPAARVRRLDETLKEAQVMARQVIQASPGEADARAPRSLPVAGFTYAHGTSCLDRPPPRFGEHNAEILAELGYDADACSRLRAAGII